MSGPTTLKHSPAAAYWLGSQNYILSNVEEHHGNMGAIELNAFEGFQNLRVIECEKPRPAPHEVLVEVKAAGINYADLELTRGKYPPPRPLPLIMGFEAAGVVVERASLANFSEHRGSRNGCSQQWRICAVYATLDAHLAIPVPEGISFAEASTVCSE